MGQPGAVLLVACYELGHQPLAVAWPAAFLERRGHAPAVLDVSVEPFDPDRARAARLVAISVPMHTALRLGVTVARRVRAVNPTGHICFYGLYATLNADYLLSQGLADSVLGGEVEDELVRLAHDVEHAPEPRSVRRRGAGAEGGPRLVASAVGGTLAPDEGPPARVDGVVEAPLPPPTPGGGQARGPAPVLAKLDFPVPSRASLPSLKKYAHLERDGQLVLAGHVEASRGCKHHCRHCPIPPVYGGRFFVVPAGVVVEDVRRLVAAGARHVTFGDPDFLNGPGHALAVARAVHAACPDLTFDFTAKVEHLLGQRRHLPELARLGCLFIVTAVESLSDTVLGHLDKGHTRGDVEAVLAAVGQAGIALRPTWVPFTPWTTLDDYREILDFVESRGLVDHVDPVQYSIRLLVPPGSRLLEGEALRPWLGELVADGFHHRWTHPDPRMDRLQEDVARLTAEAADAGEDPAVTFARIRELAEAAAGRPLRPRPPAPPAGRRRAPRLTEPWFC